MMDVHVLTKGHVFLEPRISPPTHILIPNDVSKDSQVKGLSKAQGLRHPQVLVCAIFFSNALVSSVPQVSPDRHFSMDVKLSQRTNVSMEDPFSINLESSMDQSQQSSYDNVSNKVSPIKSTTTHVLKTSQLVIPTLQELGFTKSRKCEVLKNVESSLVSGGNEKEKTDILVLRLAPHDISKVELQEGITMHEEKTWEENTTHVSMEVLHVPETMGSNSNIVDDHISGSTRNNNFSIGATSLDLEC
jgi:hypothetical protein